MIVSACCYAANILPGVKESRKHTISIALLICFLAAGQVIKSPNTTYPFTYWGMYSQVLPSQTYEEYLIELDDGTIKHYPFELVTFTSQRAFMQKMRNTEQQTAGDETREVLNRTLSGLAALYEQKNPGQTIQTFTINRVHISLTGDEPHYATSRIPLFVKEFTP